MRLGQLRSFVVFSERLLWVISGRSLVYQPNGRIAVIQLLIFGDRILNVCLHLKRTFD